MCIAIFLNEFCTCDSRDRYLIELILTVSISVADCFYEDIYIFKTNSETERGRIKKTHKNRKSKKGQIKVPHELSHAKRKKNLNTVKCKKEV